MSEDSSELLESRRKGVYELFGGLGGCWSRRRGSPSSWRADILNGCCSSSLIASNGSGSNKEQPCAPTKDVSRKSRPGRPKQSHSPGLVHTKPSSLFPDEAGTGGKGAGEGTSLFPDNRVDVDVNVVLLLLAERGAVVPRKDVNVCTGSSMFLEWGEDEYLGTV